MKFWWDGRENSTRSRNVYFTWNQLKILTDFLNKNNCNCAAKIYDFSPEKIIEESTHVPYELGEYKKSEKTNKIIAQNKDFDFIFMFDSDAFFNKEDYDKVLTTLQQLSYGDMVTFDLAKLNEKDVEQIVNNGYVDNANTNWSYAYSGEKKHGPLAHGHGGGLGGVYLCDLNLIVNSGGFDESYVGWGGEDGRMVDKIQQSGISYQHIPIRTYCPFHLPHFSDWGNEKYSKRFKE